MRQSQAARPEHPGAVEHVRGISIKGVPPREQLPWAIDRQTEQHEPRRAKLRLIAQHRRRPLRRRPHPGEDNGENDQNLADEDFGWRHENRSRIENWRHAPNHGSEIPAESRNLKLPLSTLYAPQPPSSGKSSNGGNWMGKWLANRLPAPCLQPMLNASGIAVH